MSLESLRVVLLTVQGTWQAWPHILRSAPRGWRQSHIDPVPAQADPTQPTTVPHAARRSAWARLIAKVYAVDLVGGSPCPAGALARREGSRGADSENPMLCPRYGLEMKLIALITDPPEVRRTLRHLLKIGRASPGLNPSALS